MIAPPRHLTSRHKPDKARPVRAPAKLVRTIPGGVPNRWDRLLEDTILSEKPNPTMPDVSPRPSGAEGSPGAATTVYPRPDWRRLRHCLRPHVAVVCRGCHTCVVGCDAQLRVRSAGRADSAGQVPRHHVPDTLDDDRIAVAQACRRGQAPGRSHNPWAPPRCCGLSKAPARRHPPAVARTATDHAGEYSQRDVVQPVGADLRLKQVAEHVDARTYLSDAGKAPRMQCGGRTAHRDDRRDMAGSAQPFGSAYHAGAFRLGNPHHVVQAASGIGMTRHASSCPRSTCQGAPRSPAAVVIRGDAAARFAGIDLDQRARRASRARRWRQRCRDRRSGRSRRRRPAFSLATWSSFCGVMPTA